MRKWLLPLMLAMLGLCLLLPSAALGVEFGERAYTEYDNVTLTTGSTVAQSLDWLDGFIDEEVGNIMESTTDLMEMVALVRLENASALPDASPEYRSAMDVYTRACDQNSEISFYYDRLTDLYTQHGSLVESIRSGDFLPEEIDEMKRELDALSAEADRLTQNVVLLQSQWQGDVFGIESELMNASSDRVPAPYVTAVRNLARDILRRQANDLAGQEKEINGPIVTVISDKEIAFTAIDKPGENRKGIAGVPVYVSQYGKPETKKRYVTDKDGVVVAWVADFKPNAKGIVNLDVTYAGDEMTGTKYQRRELGRIMLHGGDPFNMILKPDDGTQYIIRATIDDYDMLTIDNGYALSRFNDVDHRVAVKVDTKGKSVRVLSWYYTGGVPTWDTLFNEKFKANDATTHTITRKWLQSGVKGALPHDKKLYFSLYEGEGGLPSEPNFGDERRNSGSFKAVRSKVEQPKNGGEKEPSGLVGSVGFTIPESIPFIGGATLDYPNDKNWTIAVEPGSHLYIGYNHEFKPEKTDWKNKGAKEVEENDKAIKAVEAGTIASTKQGMKEENMRAQRKLFLAQSSITITPYFFVNIESAPWNLDKGSMCFGAGVVATYSLELTKQFHLGPVPAFISLNVSMSINMGGSIGGVARLQPNGMYKDFDFSKSGARNFNICANLSVSVTLGVGLPRFVYIGLRAAGSLTFTVGLGDKPVKPQLDLYLHADVVVKVFIFNKEWVLWEYTEHILKSGLEGQLLATSLNTVAAELDSAPPRTTAALDAANAVGATELQDALLMDNLQITSGDMKSYPYIDAQGKSYVDSFLVDQENGKDGVRWLRAADGGGTLIAKIDMSGTLPAAYKYIYEFDMDCHNGTYYFIATVGKVARATLPGSEEELKTKNEQNQGSMGCIVGKFAATDINNRVTTLKDASFSTNLIFYMPRIKALYAPHAGIEYVIGGLKIIYNYALRVSDNVAVRNGTFYQAKDAFKTMPTELAMLDFIVTDPTNNYYIPLLMVLKNADDAYREMLYGGCIGARGGTYNLIRFNNQYVYANSISEQFWERRTSTSTGFLLNLASDSKLVKQATLKQSTALLTMNRVNGGTFFDAVYKKNFEGLISIKDMGSTNASDGLKPLMVTLKNNQHQVYAYWGESRYKDETRKETEYMIKACLIDMKTKLCTPSFTWLISKSRWKR